MSNRILLFLALGFMALSALPVRAAKVAFRLTVKDGVLQEYYDNPARDHHVVSLSLVVVIFSGWLIRDD